MRWIILCIATMLATSSCKNYENNIDISYIIKYEYQLPDSINSLFLIEQNFIRKDSFYNIYFQQITDRKIFEIRIFENSICFQESSLKVKSYFSNTLIQSPDSIFTFDNNAKMLLLSDLNANTVKTYPFDNKYSPIILPSNRLVGKDSTFLLGNTSESIDFSSKKGRLNYYRKVKPVILSTISNEKLFTKEIGHFPISYITSGNNYYDFAPSSCFTKEDLICLSFFADNNLYLYKDTSLILSKVVNSNYIDEFFSLPDEKQFDMAYLKEYLLEEPRYISIKYDPYNNLFYRVVKHKYDNCLKDHNVQYWSVVITDSNLNVIGEAKFESKYEMNVFHPTPYGIALLQYNNSEAENITFVIIKLNIDEN